MIWTTDKLDIARMLIRHQSYKEAALKFSSIVNESISEEQLRSALRRHNLQKNRLPDTLNPHKPTFDNPLHINADNVAFISDLHVPYHSKTMLEHLCYIADTMKINTLCILGDLFNLEAASHYAMYGDSDPIQAELEAVGDVLSFLSTRFAYIYITSGNHDERFQRRAQMPLTLRNLIDMSLAGNETDGRIVVTEYDYMSVTTHSQRWIGGHPSVSSKYPGEVAQRLASKYKANVAVGHDHIIGFRSTEDGNYLGVSIGCMISLDNGSSPMWYKQRRLNLYQDFKNGFLAIVDGMPWLFNAYGSTCLNGIRTWEWWYTR